MDLTSTPPHFLKKLSPEDRYRMKAKLLNKKIEYIKHSTQILRNRIMHSEKIIKEQLVLKRVLYNRLLDWKCPDLNTELVVLPFDSAPIPGIDVMPSKRPRLDEGLLREKQTITPPLINKRPGKENFNYNILSTQARIESILADCTKQFNENPSC